MPTQTDVTMTADAAAKLQARAPLPVEPSRKIAVKRDVHELEIECSAESFARAFREVVTDPASTFGLIRVKRPADRLGREFQLAASASRAASRSAPRSRAPRR